MEKLKNRKEKFEYTGKLAEYQLLSQNTVMQYEIDTYSSYQNYLYKRALYGLSAITEKELESMCSKKKQRINKVYLKGQSVINVYKQKLTNTYSNSLFITLFPNSGVTKYLISNEDIDPNFKNTLTFKDLKISKDNVIDLFIKEGVLPKNFIELKQDPNQLPRLKGN
jgi:hypothetical protein